MKVILSNYKPYNRCIINYELNYINNIYLRMHYTEYHQTQLLIKDVLFQYSVRLLLISPFL